MPARPARASAGVPWTSERRAIHESMSCWVRSVRAVRTMRCEASVTWPWPHEAALSFSRISAEWMTRNFHGWRPKEEGVRVSEVSMAAQVSGEIFREGSKALVA